jgi:hypothetical protein
MRFDRFVVEINCFDPAYGVHPLLDRRRAKEVESVNSFSDDTQQASIAHHGEAAVFPA